jgi:hypothetical protein
MKEKNPFERESGFSLGFSIEMIAFSFKKEAGHSDSFYLNRG